MQSTQRLLISVDALLDTRAGTLALMDLSKSAALMKNVHYACRIVDWFEGFDQKEFAKRYAERDAKTLSMSMISRTYKILQDFVHRCFNRSLDTPHEILPEIHLNFYPYKLSEEVQELFLRALQKKVPQAPRVMAVNYSNEELTPAFLKANYGTVVCYDFFDWIEVHSRNEAIKRCPIPEVTFFTPALVKTIDEKFPKDVQEFFVDAMSYFQFFVNVVFLPVDNFSNLLSVIPKANDLSAVDPADADTTKGLDLHWT